MKFDENVNYSKCINSSLSVVFEATTNNFTGEYENVLNIPITETGSFKFTEIYKVNVALTPNSILRHILNNSESITVDKKAPIFGLFLGAGEFGVDGHFVIAIPYKNDAYNREFVIVDNGYSSIKNYLEIVNKGRTLDRVCVITDSNNSVILYGSSLGLHDVEPKK